MNATQTAQTHRGRRKPQATWSALVVLAVVFSLALNPLSQALVLGDFGTAQTALAKNRKGDRHRDRDRGQQHASGTATAAHTSAAGCQFDQRGSTWKLKASCTITAPINIPTGVTLDGNNKTITMTGPVGNYTQNVPDNWRVDAGILANGGTANVRNLTLKGSGLTGNCPVQFPEGIAFINTSGAIEKVTVAGIRVDSPRACGSGISATGTGGQHVTIRDVTVSGSPSRQLWGLSRLQTAGITVDISRAKLAVTGAPNAFGDGITYNGPVSGTISDVAVDVQVRQGVGIRVSNFGSPTARHVAIEDVAISGDGNGGIVASAVSGAPILEVDIKGADIAWKHADPTAPFGAELGISYSGGVTGTIDESSVRNTVFAGIAVQDGASLSITETDVQKGFIGLLAASGADVTVDEMKIEDFLGGVIALDPGTTAAVDESTVTGARAGPDQGFGLLYQREASGSIDETSVSRFSDTNPDTVSCGIGLAADAGPVQIGHVTYRANEQDLSDPVIFQILRRGGVGLSGPALSAAAITAQIEAATADVPNLDRPTAKDTAKRGHGKHRGRNGRR